MALYCHAQEWTAQDSIRLQRLLSQEGEIKLNPRALRELESNTYGTPMPTTEKPWMEFDNTLPVAPSPQTFSSASPHLMSEIKMPAIQLAPGGVKPSGLDFMQFFTKDFWNVSARKRRARTQEVLQDYGALSEKGEEGK